MDVWPDDFNLPPAPQIPTVALPEEEDSEDISCGGSTGPGTLDGDPEAKLLGRLDDILPELLTVSETEVP